MDSTPHIRKPMPRKGGNSFYRDKNDYSKFCVTLCGAAITDRDVDFRTAGTKKFRADGWAAKTCPTCMTLRDPDPMEVSERLENYR